MKFCSKCGNQLADEAAFCDKCGTAASAQQNPAEAVAMPPAKHSSGLGTASLILAILGFLTAFIGIGIILDVIAIILAIIVFIKSRSKPISIANAVAGTIVSGLSIAICAAILIIGNLHYSTVIPKEELMSEAIDTPLRTLAVEKYTNEAVFKENYDGKACKITGIVDDITDDYLRLVWRTGNTALFTNEEKEAMGDDSFFASSYAINVYFADNEELKSISKSDHITVVGKFDTDSGNLKSAYTINELHGLQGSRPDYHSANK